MNKTAIAAPGLEIGMAFLLSRLSEDQHRAEELTPVGLAHGGVTGIFEWFDNLNTAIRQRVAWRGHFYAQDDNHLSFNGGGRRNAANKFDALRFKFSSGNIASGKWALYGYA